VARLIREATNTLLDQAAALLNDPAGDGKHREHQARLNNTIFQLTSCTHFLDGEFGKNTEAGSSGSSRLTKQGKEPK
jgi:hypothetical protein